MSATARRARSQVIRMAGAGLLAAGLLVSSSARAEVAVGVGVAAGVGQSHAAGGAVPVLQLRGIVEATLASWLTVRAQPTFLSTWGERTRADYYGLPLVSRDRAHTLVLPVMLGFQPTRWLGLYAGPAVGVGWGHYERNVCAGGWKTSVPYGGQADVVFRAPWLGHLELGVSAATLKGMPLIECVNGPAPSARVDDDTFLSVSASAAYRFW